MYAQPPALFIFCIFPSTPQKTLLKMDSTSQRTMSCPPSLRSPDLTDVSGPIRTSYKVGSKGYYSLHPAVRRRLSGIENSSSSQAAHDEKASTTGDQLQVAFSHPGMPDEEYLIMMAVSWRSASRYFKLFFY